MLNNLVIFALIFFSSSTPAQKLSDLELVANDFFILARITNAIALQSSMLRKDVQPHEIISELLAIPHDEFSKMVNISAEIARSAIEKLEKEVRKIDVSKLTAKKDLTLLAEKTDEIGSIMTKIEKFPFDETFSADDLRFAIEETFKDMSLFDGKCPGVNFAFLMNSAMRFEGSGRSKNRRNATEDLETIGNQLKLTLDCFEGLNAFHTTLKNFPLLEANNKFETAFLSSSRLFKNGKEVVDELPKLKNDLDASKHLWTGNSFSSELENVASELSKSTNACTSHLDNPYRVDPLRTVSFLKPEDLLLVKKDVESAWFKKHFVRGSPEVKNLSIALKPFHNVSEVVLMLANVWRPFIEKLESQKRNDDYKKDDSLKTVSDYLQVFASFLKHQDLGYSQVVEKTEKVWKSCSRKPEKDFELIWERFNKQEKPMEYLVTNFTKAVTRFDGYLDTSKNAFLRITPEIISHCLKSTLQRYNKVVGDDSYEDDNKIREVTREFRRCARLTPISNVKFEGHFSDIARILGRLEKFVIDFSTLVSEYRSGITATTTTAPDATPEPSVTLQEIIHKSNVVVMMQCLRKENFRPVELHKVVGFVNGVRNFPDKTTMATTIGYLKSLKSIRSTLKTVENAIISVGTGAKKLDRFNTVLLMNNSRTHAEDFGVCTIALWNLIEVQKRRETFLGIGDFHPSFSKWLSSEGLNGFRNSKEELRRLVRAAERVNNVAKMLKGQTPMKMAEIFDQMTDIEGINDLRSTLLQFKKETNKNKDFWENATKQIDTLLEINLNFATYRGRLLDGRSLVNGFRKYFDEIFNLSKKPESATPTSHSVAMLIGVCIGSAFLVIIIGLIIFALTKRGREKFRIVYLYYFGKPEDFEKRWRYSCFMDKVNGENALLDSVRETNKANMLIALKRGVYVNAYNNFGNTALHAATKGGHPELVEILIRHGADRTLLNVKNCTPEQMVPAHFKLKYPDHAEKYEQIQNIYKKYRNKDFRIRVPELFPVSSFRIWPEERTDDALTNKFLAVFQHIASIETSSRVTHCVMKTDENGILETDSLNLLFWIFNGCIIVREQWMTDCIQNEKLIEQDYNYLVDKVRYKGVVYDTVLQWSNGMAKGEIPYLYGVQVAVVMKEYPNMFVLAGIVNSHGGTMLDEFPNKKKYRPGSRPYLHAHLGPLFIIHDGTFDLSAYAKDKMFTFFTEETFIRFMLKREIYKDSCEEPISVLKDVE